MRRKISKQKMLRIAELATKDLPDIVADEGLPENTCILSARVLTVVFSKLGIPATPLDCKVMVMNDVYFKKMEEKSIPSEADIDEWAEAGARSVAAGYNQEVQGKSRLGGYDGHVIVIVMNRWACDPTLGQMSRPDRGIVLEPALFEMPAEMRRGEPSYLLAQVNQHPTAHVLYTPRPTNKRFLQAPDWVGIKTNDTIIKRLMAKINEL